MKILITDRVAISLTDTDKRTEFQPYELVRTDLGEIRTGDRVNVTYDGNQEIIDVAINPSNSTVNEMIDKARKQSEALARDLAEDYEGDPEKWEEHLADGYPCMIWYEAIIGGEDDAADLKIVDMQELLNKDFEMPF